MITEGGDLIASVSYVVQLYLVQKLTSGTKAFQDNAI